MGFTREELNGYTTGVRYEKRLRFVAMGGNSNKRLVFLEDEEKNELLWTTTDSTKAYKQFRLDAVYRFTVDCILDESITSFPDIQIRNVTLVDTKLQEGLI